MIRIRDRVLSQLPSAKVPKAPRVFTKKAGSSTADFDRQKAAQAKRVRRRVANLELVADGVMPMSRAKPKGTIDVASMADLERLERMAAARR